MQTEIHRSLPKQNLENFPRFKHNNITLVPLAFEHNLDTLNINRTSIFNAMQEADYTIFEYFPYEIEQESPGFAVRPKEDPTHGRRTDGYYRFYWKTIKPFFDEVTSMTDLLDHPKLLLLDPAHDFAFVYAQQLFPLTNTAEAMLVSKLVRMKKDTRRKFLYFLAGTALAVHINDWIELTIEQQTGIAMVLNEATFRRAVVAEGIDILSKDRRYKGATVNLLYPPTHIEGILEMLDNPIRRKAEIYTHKADVLMLLPGLRDSLFTIRQYQKDKNNKAKWLKNIVARI